MKKTITLDSFKQMISQPSNGNSTVVHFDTENSGYFRHSEYFRYMTLLIERDFSNQELKNDFRCEVHLEDDVEIIDDECETVCVSQLSKMVDLEHYKHNIDYKSHVNEFDFVEDMGNVDTKKEFHVLKRIGQPHIRFNGEIIGTLRVDRGLHENKYVLYNVDGTYLLHINDGDLIPVVADILGRYVDKGVADTLVGWIE